MFFVERVNKVVVACGTLRIEIVRSSLHMVLYGFRKWKGLVCR